MLQKLLYIEQLADVIATKCSIWKGPHVDKAHEIPYERVLKLTVEELLEMMKTQNYYFKPDQR